MNARRWSFAFFGLCCTFKVYFHFQIFSQFCEFLGPRVALIEPSIPSRPSATISLLFLFLLLLLLLYILLFLLLLLPYRHPCHPGGPLHPIVVVAYDLPEGPASCKQSYGCTGIGQMIIWRDPPLANDHAEGPDSCK